MLKPRKQKGQAYIETILVLPIFALFLAGIYFFGLVFINQAQLKMAARHGVFLIVHENFSDVEVKAEVIDYLQSSRPAVLLDGGNIEVNQGDWNEPAHVKISYPVPLPGLLKVIFTDNKFEIFGYSAVHNDSFYFGYPSGRSRS